MDYRVGSHIPEEKILRRFKDEDGEIFLEVRGIEDAYYRVTADNHVYYRIEKALMQEEELTLINDFSGPGDNPESVLELAEYEAGEPIIEMGPDMMMKEEYIRPKADSEEELEVTELEEGQVVPSFLRPLCKRTGYGGYSLRYRKFLYMLDKDYRVDMKSADSMANYMMDNEVKIAEIKPVIPINIEMEDPIQPIQPPNSPERKTNSDVKEKSEYKRGDILPASLRDRCEEDMVTGGGRIIIGNYLYLLDANFVVTARMKLAYSEGDAAAPIVSTVPLEQLTVEQIVTNVVKHFESGLEKYNISADLFKESALAPENMETLRRCYRGDLTGLNDDTREAAARGKLAELAGEKGFTLLKAALLHELYIKSTLTGRGTNMKFYVTHIIAIEPDGRINESLGDWTSKKQQELLNFFNNQATIYKDKTMLIRQLYWNLRSTIFKDYKAIRDVGGKVSFNAFLIVKLYEHTTRLDRGDGITIIRLSRDLMDYK